MKLFCPLQLFNSYCIAIGFRRCILHCNGVVLKMKIFCLSPSSTERCQCKKIISWGISDDHERNERFIITTPCEFNPRKWAVGSPSPSLAGPSPTLDCLAWPLPPIYHNCTTLHHINPLQVPPHLTLSYLTKYLTLSYVTVHLTLP